MSTVIPIRPGVRIMAESERGQFFVADKDTLLAACEIGTNAAAAYLALACGSGGDNTSTCWGAKAVARYTGVRWRTADKAIKELQEFDVIRHVGKVGVWPQYKIDRQGEPIWLPREIIEGVTIPETGEVLPGPIKQLRQSQDSMLIRLLVELYHAQNLWECDGISTDVIRREYERAKLGTFGANDIWLFDLESVYMTRGNPIAEPHREGKDIQPFFDRFRTLVSLGLVEWTACVMECDGGEPVFYIDHEMQDEVFDAAFAITPEQYEYRIENSCYAVPMPRHMQHVQMQGVARLTFRPKTKATSAWFGEYMDMQREHIRRYRAMAGKPFMGAYSGDNASEKPQLSQGVA